MDGDALGPGEAHAVKKHGDSASSCFLDKTWNGSEEGIEGETASKGKWEQSAMHLGRGFFVEGLRAVEGEK